MLIKHERKPSALLAYEAVIEQEVMSCTIQVLPTIVREHICSIYNHICGISFDYGFKFYYFHYKSRIKLSDIMDLCPLLSDSKLVHFNGHCGI